MWILNFPIMILLNICHIVVLPLSSGEVELFNAEQSSTVCNSATCYPASNAIDGYWETFSRTDPASGHVRHWLQVSMSNTPVDQILYGPLYEIVLRGGTYHGGEITVSLYSGETLAGQCESYTGYIGTKTLSCDRVTADRVLLTTSSTSRTWLIVYDINVKRALTNTIGI